MKQMKKIKVVQICVKWRENSSKVIFGILGPQPKKVGGRAKKILSKMKKSKLFKIA